MKKIILIILFISLIISCKKEEEVKTDIVKAEKVTPVVVQTVSKSELNRVISSNSTIRANQELFIVAEGGGTIREVRFKLGDFVKKDQLLVKIDDELATTALNMAKANLETAKLNLKIAQQLFDNKNSSELELSSAKAQFVAAETAVVQARKNLENAVIKAPFSGYIASLENGIVKGGLVAPGTPVAKLIDLSSLKCKFEIGEFDIAYIKKGMKAKIEISAASKVENGTVSAISYQANDLNGTFAVEVSWPNQNLNSYAGMSANLDITTNTSQAIITVPNEAIVKSDQKEGVFVVQKSRAVLRYIKSGQRANNLVEIIDGVIEGDSLIVSGQNILKSGDKISATVGQAGGK